MQLSLTYKKCACEKCDSAKDCLTPIAKSINADRSSNQASGQPVRHRTFSRARQSRPRARHSYGNQLHRLDHTYAAAELTISEPVEAPAAATTMSNGYHQQYQPRQQQIVDPLLKIDGDLALSAAWSTKALDLQCRQRSSWSKDAHDQKNKENEPPLAKLNGILKEFQKYQKVNSKIPGISATAIGTRKAMKLLNEERKRWIAATALLELSRVAVIFYN